MRCRTAENPPVNVKTALTLAIIAEGAGYVVPLIPKRTKQLKDEWRREGLEQCLERDIKRGRAEEHVGKAFARFERGEITIDVLRRLTSDRD